MLVDLHTHSTASDGQYRPEELVIMAYDKGITLYAITDHDTISGIGEANLCLKRLREKGISEEIFSFIAGVEISCQDIEEIHLLGYGIDVNDRGLLEACEAFSAAREDRGLLIKEYLSTKGIEVDLNVVKSYASDGNLGRPHFAKYLVEMGIATDRKDAFSRYLDTPEFREATYRQKPSCEEAIRIIHGAKGKAVLAHPGCYMMDHDKLDDLVRRLVGMGMDGIECFYSKHSRAQTEEYLEYIRKYGLKTSCGSDYHGETVKADVSLGMVFDEKYKADLMMGLLQGT